VCFHSHQAIPSFIEIFCYVCAPCFGIQTGEIDVTTFEAITPLFNRTQRSTLQFVVAFPIFTNISSFVQISGNSPIIIGPQFLQAGIVVQNVYTPFGAGYAGNYLAPPLPWAILLLKTIVPCNFALNISLTSFSVAVIGNPFITAKISYNAALSTCSTVCLGNCTTTSCIQMWQIKLFPTDPSACTLTGTVCAAHEEKY
jgi:hypothetical protein